MGTPAEDKVKRLAKLKANTTCPNCGTHKKFGFGSVCIKFHTFICNECKSSHQAISHRCKSTTMSSWTDAEVAELESKGNDYCRRTWLQNAPPTGQGGRPELGMDLNVYKRFVVQAYENKRYYGNDDGAVVAAAPVAAAPVAAAPVAAAPVAAARKKKPVIVRAPASAPTGMYPAVDLLDFSAAPASVATPSADLFAADFGPMTSAPTASTTTNNAFATSFPLLSKPTIAPAPVSAGFNLSSMQAQPNSLSDFDGLSTPSTMGGSTGKKSIMGGSGGCASVISMIPAPPQQQSNNNSMGMQQQQQMQQQQRMMMQQQQQMGSGMHQQINPTHQQQQQFMMMQQQQQQMAAMQQRTMAMNINGGGGMQQNSMNGNNMVGSSGSSNISSMMNPGMMGGGSMNGSGGGMGMGMNNNGMGMQNNTGMQSNHGMSMNNSFGRTPQRSQMSMNDNSMPGGNVMSMMNYTTKKK
jgi:hypothetical protein